MSKDLFQIIRERDLIREAEKQELDYHYRILELRGWYYISKNRKK